MKETEDQNVQLVPIKQIRVLNPRARDPKKFKQIVDSIANLGLKKPISVSPIKRSKTDEPEYNLVCGQGRLEAFVTLGQDQIPAIVRRLSKEECLLMSLAENLARRNPTTVEQFAAIASLKERGYSPKEIASKVDLSLTHVSGLLNLWQKGEERLLDAVEKQRIPIVVAMEIANSSDVEIQRALTTAYEEEKLKGKALIKARKIVEQRRHHGKALRGITGSRKNNGKTNADSLVRAYEQEMKKQKHFVQKGRLCETRFLFITSALQQLLADENFVNLLRAEKLNTLPKSLAEHIRRKEVL